MRYAVIALVVMMAAPARADRVIRLGTVGKGVDRGAVEAALDGAFRGMTPCFRRAGGAGTIKVKVEVGSDGEVVAASAATKGAAAQCVAGLLAVTKFPGGAWKSEVQVDAVDPGEWLNAALAKHQAELSACQDKDAAGKGEVALALVIDKGGAVTSASIEKTAAGKAIAECAKAAALKIDVGTLPGGQDVKYRMSVTYNGGSTSSGTTSSSGTTGATGTTTTSGEGGTVKGALAGSAVQKAWEDQRAKALACGAKMAKGAAVTVGFAIRANGTVKNVVFKSSSVDKPVEDCVDKELRAVKFPTANGETQVTIPISWKK